MVLFVLGPLSSPLEFRPSTLNLYPPFPMTLNIILHSVNKALLPVAGERARYETELLLEHVLSCSRSDLYCAGDCTIDNATEKRIKKYVAERLRGTPIEYVLGVAYFYNREFTVTSDVLIPRPETEVIVETILDNETDEGSFFLDTGTGPGTIIGALVKERPSWYGIGTDISFPALRVAHKNLGNHAALLCTDLTAALTPAATFDFIVCNPPYIALHEAPELDRSVIDYEPSIALFGGKEGLDYYRRMANLALPLLKEHGSIYFEIGATQKEQVTVIFTDAGWHDIRCVQDLAGRDRVVAAKKG
ncbi:MAG: peptide chain release factor N(5)-glutamine methyltransferase [Chitinivibrionales bacterium]|nr:peptide chain release factor N(5)-glutamine methyltransferase [Chitinivibrionales bacterium]